MAARRIVGLRKSGSDKKNFSVKVDSEVLDAFTAIEERVKNEMSGQVVNRSDIVEDAMRQFVKDATQELDKKKK